MASHAVKADVETEADEIAGLLVDLQLSEAARVAAMKRLRAVAAAADAGSQRLRQALPDLFA